MKFTINELSGSLGDLGTFLPLVIALAKLNLIKINTVLFYAGLLNILTAFSWDIPMPVQPMKSIASIAITEGLTSQEILTSGILTGSIVFVLGITNFIDKINKHIPLSLISGIQFGLGLKMSINGIKLISDTNWNQIDGIITGIILSFLTYFSFNIKRFPSALILTLLGITYSIIKLIYYSDNIIEYKFVTPFSIDEIKTVETYDWYNGFIKGSLPQLPLTLLNSVISVCKLSDDLFPNNKKTTRKSVAISVGLMNIITCPFGGLPMCHGAGGLAGQYKFGARNGASILLLGIIKIMISLTLGNILIILLDIFPQCILGTLLLFSGYELSNKAIHNIKNIIPTEENNINDLIIFTAIVQMATNTYIGFLTGYSIYIFKKMYFKYLNNTITLTH